MFAGAQTQGQICFFCIVKKPNQSAYDLLEASRSPSCLGALKPTFLFSESGRFVFFFFFFRALVDKKPNRRTQELSVPKPAF